MRSQFNYRDGGGGRVERRGGEKKNALINYERN